MQAVFGFLVIGLVLGGLWLALEYWPITVALVVVVILMRSIQADRKRELNRTAFRGGSLG